MANENGQTTMMPNLKLNQTSSRNNKLDPVSKDSLKSQYVLIAGPGRSGTTWLGQIMNTYEHCCYKYEPFLPSKSTPYRLECMNKIK